MPPSWTRFSASTYPSSCRRCVPAPTPRPLAFAASAVASTERMPGPSTATGFSVKTFLPAATAASRWVGRKPGGVARIT